MSVLWLRALPGGVTEEDCAAFYGACEPLRPVVWTARSGKTVDLTMGGNLEETFIDVLVETQRRVWRPSNSLLSAGLLGINETFISQVGFVRPGNVGLFASFFRPFELHSRAVMAFAPAEQWRAVLAWSRVFHGLEWLWISQDLTADAPQPTIDPDSVVRSYVAVTAGIRGIACVSWLDSNMRAGLAMLADGRRLSELAESFGSSPSYRRYDGLLRDMLGVGFVIH